MPEFKVNEAVYYFTEQGDGDPLILLHGFIGSTQNWSAVTPTLASAYRVIAVDILGHGLSSSPAEPQRYHIGAVANDLAFILAAITTMPVHLIGYSMGARLALYFALTYPQFVRKLVLESGSPGLETPEEQSSRVESDDQLAGWLLENGITAFIDRWERLPLFESQMRLSVEILAKQRAQRLQSNPTGLANSLRGMGAGCQPSLWGKLDTLSAPTLLITGALDHKYCMIAQRMAQMIPDATLQIVPDAGHNVHLERAEIYLQLTKSFLQG